MKNLITAAVIALISGTGAGIAASSIDIHEIQGYAPSADLSTLSDRQVEMLLLIIHGNKNEGRKYQQVRSFLLRAEGGSFLNKLFE